MAGRAEGGLHPIGTGPYRHVEERPGDPHRFEGQNLYDDYRGAMPGIRSITWAMTRTVGGWQTLAFVPLETNYDDVSAAS